MMEISVKQLVFNNHQVDNQKVIILIHSSLSFIDLIIPFRIMVRMLKSIITVFVLFTSLHVSPRLTQKQSFACPYNILLFLTHLFLLGMSNRIMVFLNRISIHIFKRDYLLFHSSFNLILSTFFISFLLVLIYKTFSI
jgi:hypothetical protein